MGENVDKEEVLRYLGYKGQEISSEINSLIDICRKEIVSKSKPRYIYEYFNIEDIDTGISLKNTTLILRGNDIKEHLKGCSKIAILVVTLGLEIEKHMNFTEKIDLTKSIILDSCATTYIEEICDKIGYEIKGDMEEKDLSITSRYSPGYGDLPLDMQGELLSVVSSSKRIGVTTSKHHLLFPRKSVTAIIGISSNNIIKIEKDCSKCNMYNKCNYRKGGKNCGSK